MERKYLTVSAVNRYLKYKFDNDVNLQSILLKAEISNFKRHSRGHLYLTLKDETSEISAVMFQGNTRSLTFDPKDGDKVIIEGHISIYEPRGSYQVYIKKMDIDGIGDLYLAYEKLKKELEEKGYFSSDHKQSLPRYPKTVGVITSPTGAAVRDIMNVISLRYPLAKIIVYPALVQGVNAKDSIEDQIKQANKDQFVDVLIVGRGGGSIEDLWAFNELNVAMAIYNSKIPIISAVGHETDFTIADFVSDLRASTPSHAAEICVPSKQDILENISNSVERFNISLNNIYLDKQTRFKKIISSNVLVNPEKLTENTLLKLSYLEDKLNAYKPDVQIKTFNDTINNYIIRMNQLVVNQLDKQNTHILNIYQRLDNKSNTLLYKKQNDFVNLTNKLDLVNPLSIMKKGYTVSKQDTHIKKSVKELDLNKDLIVDFYDGSVITKIKEVK